MNMQRITISLPKYLYENLVRQIPAGKVSSFVTQAIEKRLMMLPVDPIDEFIALREKLPKRKKLEIIKAIKRGRV